MNKNFLIYLITFIILIALILASYLILDNKNLDIRLNNPHNSTNDKIIIEIIVVCDTPPSDSYKLIGRKAKNVSLYKFFYTIKNVPGSGTFERIKTVPLKKIGDNKYRGVMVINRSQLLENYTYCVGYPPLNYIDNKTCVVINPKNNISHLKVLVHYWRPLKAIG